MKEKKSLIFLLVAVFFFCFSPLVLNAAQSKEDENADKDEYIEENTEKEEANATKDAEENEETEAKETGQESEAATDDSKEESTSENAEESTETEEPTDITDSEESTENNEDEIESSDSKTNEDETESSDSKTEEEETKETPEKRNMSIQSAEVPFQQGDRHERIVGFKQQLNALGFDRISETSYFGNWTETRVKQFQEYYGLGVDGILGPKTIDELNNNTQLREGNRHDDMIQLKEKLNQIGYGNIKVTTYYGSFTEQQVRKFQEDHGLKVNGIIDKITRAKINELAETASVPYELGDRHDEIVSLKQKLNAIGFDRISETNYFGNWTETRVTQFQEYYGLTVNGKLDEATIEELNTVYNSPLQEGERHDDMINLKEKLNRIGYGYITVTTLFGSFTEQQVRKFQEDHGLKVNGIIDKITRDRIDFLAKTDGFQKGDSHDNIIELKQKLNAIGFDRISETNYFGNWTETRVSQFQEYYGLTVNGVLDTATVEQLNKIYSHPFQQGNTHDDIEELKQKLNRIGYGYITVTELYGSFTERQVKKFQEDHGLKVNGIADEVTVAKIDELFKIKGYYQQGDRIDDIVELKEKLNAIGFDRISETNYFGNWAETRVIQFQEYYGLPVNGRLDVATIEELDDIYNSPLQEGKRHDDMIDLKEKLNRIGYGYITVTSLYGSFTAQQVRKFQEDHGLKVNGIIDKITRAKVDEIVKEFGFQQGDTHEDLIGLKEKLNAIGFDGISETNYFGNWTETRVIQFQGYYGTPVNGILDRVTVEKLDEVYNSPFQEGKRHEATVELKQKLNEIGYGYITVTTLYGSFTAQQVREFQEDNGLRVNGIADEVTLAKIDEVFRTRTIVNYQQFDITLEEALNTQMGQLQQTDKYRNDPAYIHSNYVEITEGGIITGSGVNLRTAPNFNNNVHATVDLNTTVEILDEVDGALYEGSTRWYEISYDDKTLYVHTSLANSNGMIATTTGDNVNIRAGASTSSHIFDTVDEGTTINITEIGNIWHKISYGTWRNPTRNEVKDYLDPSNNDEFQHLVLSSSVGVSATELNNVLDGKGELHGLGQAFIDGGRQHSVNEIYLISHALLETGHGTSDLAEGIEVGLNSSGNPILVTSSNRSSLTEIETTYNMFGIGAADSDPNRLGAVRAYNEGWFSPEEAIIGGAEFIGEDYIHNQHNQNTLYKMRWNPANPGYPQYATDIAWATKQVTNIKGMYSMLNNPLLQFNISRYR